jgi:hypothetical protein
VTDDTRAAHFNCNCPHTPYSATVHRRAASIIGRRSFLAGLGALGAGIVLWPRRALGAPQAIVLRAARLFDGIAMRTPGVLVIKGDRIVSMTALDAGADAHVVDLATRRSCRV